MHNFKELKVWQKAVQLAVDLYKNTEHFPSEEKYGMISQMRRSAVSVSSNIAEGCGRKTDKSLSHFLSHSLGSQYELETQLIISNKIGFIDDAGFESLISRLNEIQKITQTLIQKFTGV